VSCGVGVEAIGATYPVACTQQTEHVCHLGTVCRRRMADDVVQTLWYEAGKAFQNDDAKLNGSWNLPRIAKGNWAAVFDRGTRSTLKLGHRGGVSDTPGATDEQGFYLGGRIDEAHLFIGKALTHEEIRSIVGARSAGICRPLPQA
jgi:hypothetical protein